MQNKSLFGAVIASLVLVVGLLLGVFLVDWSGVDWGKVKFGQDETVVVVGSAKTTQANQIARFSAGVSVVNDDKDTAVAEVNTEVEGIINAAKDFGIAEADIQTENLSVYRQEDSYYDPDSGSQKGRPGQWRVSNSVSMILRNVSRASDFAGVLFETGATNVYGPNFSTDDTSETELGLYGEAIKDARERAEKIAAASGRSLGKVLSVTEGGSSSYPVSFAAEGRGGGAPVEPGSATVSTSLTVTFELR